MDPLIADADFTVIESMDIVFVSETAPRQCFPVAIVDDDILENTEIFHVSILPTNDIAVVLQNPVLSIGIENDDST